MIFIGSLSGGRYAVLQGTAGLLQTSARQTIAAMDQNFGIALPQATSRVVDAVSSGEQAWKIETFSDTPGNVSVFIERQKQIEELLVNSIGMPIRLFQEGRASGSRAELESFTGIAVTIMESRNKPA